MVDICNTSRKTSIGNSNRTSQKRRATSSLSKKRRESGNFIPIKFLYTFYRNFRQIWCVPGISPWNRRWILCRFRIHTRLELNSQSHLRLLVKFYSLSVTFSRIFSWEGRFIICCAVSCFSLTNNHFSCKTKQSARMMKMFPVWHEMGRMWFSLLFQCIWYWYGENTIFVRCS